MSDPASRLEQLEARYAWLERHIVEQDREMLALGEAVRRLKEELAAQRSGSRPPTSAPDASESAESPPPHY